MSTVALGIGLVVGNLISPGTGLNVPRDPSAGEKPAEEAHGAGGAMDFIQDIIPKTLFSSLTEGNVLQASCGWRRSVGSVRSQKWSATPALTQYFSYWF
jgi:Na+/H+-dicarboxylate symporter